MPREGMPESRGNDPLPIIRERVPGEQEVLAPAAPRMEVKPLETQTHHSVDIVAARKDLIQSMGAEGREVEAGSDVLSYQELGVKLEDALLSLGEQPLFDDVKNLVERVFAESKATRFLNREGVSFSAEDLLRRLQFLADLAHNNDISPQERRRVFRQNIGGVTSAGGLITLVTSLFEKTAQGYGSAWREPDSTASVTKPDLRERLLQFFRIKK